MTMSPPTAIVALTVFAGASLCSGEGVSVGSAAGATVTGAVSSGVGSGASSPPPSERTRTSIIASAAIIPRAMSANLSLLFIYIPRLVKGQRTYSAVTAQPAGQNVSSFSVAPTGARKRT